MWITKAPVDMPGATHTCVPPQRHPVRPMPPRSLMADPSKWKPTYEAHGWEPDGEFGDVWMCDDCLTVWMIHREPHRMSSHGPTVFRPKWKQAGWFRSRQVRRKAGWI